MKRTILLLMMMQTPGPFFNRDDDAAFAGQMITMLKIFGALVGIFIFLSLVLYVLHRIGYVGEGRVEEESATSAAVPSSRARAEQPAIGSCNFCGSRLTRNRVTEAGNCVSCGGPVESAEVVV